MYQHTSNTAQYFYAKENCLGIFRLSPKPAKLDGKSFKLQHPST